MESLAGPLRVLLEESGWFVRERRLRVLRVRTTADLAGTVGKLLMAQECHADNKSLFLRFDDPALGFARGWPARIARLRQQFEEKAKGLVSVGIQLGPLPERAAGQPGTAAEFAALLLAAASSVPAPLEGLTVVLAPVRVESEGASTWVREIEAMVSAQGLKKVRWVLVDIDRDTTAEIAHGLDAEAATCQVIIDGAAAQEDVAAQIDALAQPAGQGDAVRGALRRVLDPDAQPIPLTAVEPRWQSAGAMPDVQPTRRVGAPGAASDEALRAVGLSPGYVRGGAQALRTMILSASLAARREEMGEAVAFQARAAELCGVMEMPLEQVVNLMVLASYLLAVPARTEARKVYRRAVDIAGAHNLLLQQAQAVMGLGMLDTVERDPVSAATHYIEAARLAESAGVPALAIECWRMAGQLALAAGAEAQAVECWKKAIALCEPLAPEAARATSAAEVGRALAAVVRKRGQEVQARSLEEQSHRWEHGLPPPDDRSPGAARPEGRSGQPSTETTP